jgi:hypothetical protein
VARGVHVGLLHGFGFASALSEVGLQLNSIPTALLFFNVGVEVGQLIFIATVLGTTAIAQQIAGSFNGRHHTWTWRVPPYAIGSVAMFWVIQRVASF